MTTERIIRICAGLMILLSTTLGLLHSPWWFALTLFVGLNLFQFGFTQFCPMEVLLKKMGYPSWKDMAEKQTPPRADEPK
ncbi:MAG: DUF2892 domain-containing protein [bacterium]|jgi:hypothetical protein|nr:DUF2892 domain-containing protein [bacterium]